MGAIKDLSICFPSVGSWVDKYIYVPGDVIHGRLVADVQEAVQVREASVVIQGVSRCQWVATTEPRTKHSSEQLIFRNHITLKSECTLEGGQHMLTFESDPIPGDVPPSFEGEFGTCRYEVVGRISTGSQQWVVRRVLSVVPRREVLAAEQLSTQVVEDEGGESWVCGCCCHRGPALLTMSVNQQTFVPGEYMSVWGVANTERCDAGAMVALGGTLTQTVTWVTESQAMRQEVRDVCLLQFPEVAAGERVEVESACTRIPACCPSGNLGRGVLSYQVRVVMMVLGLDRALTVNIPITVGSERQGLQGSRSYEPAQTTAPHTHLPEQKGNEERFGDWEAFQPCYPFYKVGLFGVSFKTNEQL